MGMRHDGWAELVNDGEHGGCLIPMMMLCHEHDEDPEMRPESISPEKREDVIAHMAAGLLQAYRYFRAHRQVKPGAHTSEPRSQCSQGRAERSVSVRLREEVQTLLRWGDCELSALWLPR
jgi:hypothetical protein